MSTKHGDLHRGRTPIGESKSKPLSHCPFTSTEDNMRDLILRQSVVTTHLRCNSQLVVIDSELLETKSDIRVMFDNAATVEDET